MASPALDDSNFHLSGSSGVGGGGTGSSSHSAAGVSHLVRSGVFKFERSEGMMKEMKGGRGGRERRLSLLISPHALLIHLTLLSPLPSTHI